MEAVAVFQIAASVFAFCGMVGVCFVATTHVLHASRLRSASIRGLDGGVFGSLLRNGFTPFRDLADRLLRFGPVTHAADQLQTLMWEKGVETRSSSLVSLALAAVTAIGLLAAVLSRSLFCGLLCSGCSVVLGTIVLRTRFEKRVSVLRENIPDALQAMESCVVAGYSLPQTFAQMSQETGGALQALFSRCSQVLQTGGSSSQALAVLKNEHELPELVFVAVALDVAHQTGGSMAQILQSAQQMAKDKLELSRSLRVQTAQAQLSARIVSILPFGILALISLMSENYLASFFSSIAGIVLFVFACMLQIAGVLAVKRIVKRC